MGISARIYSNVRECDCECVLYERLYCMFALSVYKFINVFGFLAKGFTCLNLSKFVPLYKTTVGDVQCMLLADIGKQRLVSAALKRTSRAHRGAT